MSFQSTSQILNAADAAKVRNTNAIMAGWIDRGPWQYRDTLTLTQGVNGFAGVLQNEYSMFSVQIGAQDPYTAVQKTKLQTNMVRPNQFPPPRCLLLMALGFEFVTMTKADIDLIVNNCYMEFKIDEKVYHEGWLEQYPPGVGLTGVTTNTSESSWVNGLASPFYQRRYNDWSKYIAPEQQFSLTLFFPNPPTVAGNVLIRILMDGLTDRSVQ